MAAQQRERQYAGADRYATSLFYGGQPERHDSRSAFTATYSNGQARPITSIVSPTLSHGRAPSIASTQPAPCVLSNGSSSADRVVFSFETRNLDTARPFERTAPPRVSQPAGRGDAGGPLYSDNFRFALDSLLGQA